MRNKSLMGMTIAIILAIIVGPSMGTTMNMPSGTQSITAEAGKSVGNVVYSFDYDITGIQADILAIATATGKGSVTANAYGNVNPEAIGSVATLGALAATGITVSTKGTVDVNVKGTSDDAKVTSMAQIHSKASKTATSLEGEAWIRSEIGNEWTVAAGDSYQKGKVTGIPVGQFYADSKAEGVASYEGSITVGLVAPAVPQTFSVSGSTDGKTTLKSEVKNVKAAIGKTLLGLTTENPAYSHMSSHSLVSGAFVAGTNKLVSGKIEADNKNEISIAASNSRDLCEEDPLGGLSWVSGTVAGKGDAKSKSYYNDCNPTSGLCDRETFAANTERKTQ